MATGSDLNGGWAPQAGPGRLARPKPDRDQQGALGWVPGVHVVRHYRLAWLPRDLTAGVVLTAVLVPVGMAYAQAAGLPAIIGLYASIFPLLAYAVFGPSRILIVGPDSALTPLIATAIVPLALGDVNRAITLAAALGIMSGLFCILVGLLRLGFVTELLSKPIRYGYMNGIALMVLVSQLPRLFGFSAGGDNLPSRLLAIGEGVVQGRTNLAALAIGVATLVVVLLLKRWRQVPGVLIAVVGATLVVSLLDLAGRAGVPVVGPLPQGLPAPALPLVSPRDLEALATAAIAIAAVTVRANERAVAHLLGERGQLRRSESRDGGAGHREPCGGPVPGVPDQQRGIAHAGGRECRRPHAADRRGRGRVRGAAPAGGAEPAAERAERRPRRSRDRRGDRAI